LIQKDGFGAVFWNECGEQLCVTIEVLDIQLAEEFVRNGNPNIYY